MKPRLPAERVDRVLKALLVLSRAADQILETHAVRAAVDEPLSHSKVQVLRLLGYHRGQTSTQIARFLGVTKPAVSQIIDGMVRAKLVMRRPVPHDRREVALDLTKRGRLRFHAVRHQQRHLLRTALRLSHSGDADRWAETLQEIVTALTEADRAFEEYCLQCSAHADDTCVLVGGKADCPLFQTRKRPAQRSARKTPQRPSRRRG